ncbi:MAG: hypothetical protein KF729_08435 [Sandaracinaceae bacterium]|nr:hypothetical protein [Sandaracinaceae bacterium]
MTESKRTARRATDSLVLLGLALAGLALAIGGPLLPIPMLGLIGLPIAGLGAAAFALLALCLGTFEVPWWRQLAGLGLAAASLYVLGSAYLGGLATIAEHFLGRDGAPPLGALWRSVPCLSIGAAGLAASVAARRPAGAGSGAALGAGAIACASAGLGWAILIALGLLGFPFGA